MSSSPKIRVKGSRCCCRWMGPGTDIRVTALQEARSDKMRSSSIERDSRTGNIEFGGVEFFLNVDVQLADDDPLTEPEKLFLAYIH